ncbi:adenosylcobinamide-GDP ribazoletransferase [Roseovarius sp. SYSU LYC5161]|uniref:adenosylcobinamide-GDP ribazoletransferase n=1 Tax=Roseovarius halophilus (ex Wu et al. 2025) TaxID=3376060 RepID=UPI00399C4982
MAKSDDALVHAADFPLAMALLTRLPIHVEAGHRAARAAWAYPLVGIVTAGLGALAGLTGLSLGLSAPLSALVALVTQILATGALHEDGLADTADGIGGGWTRTRRLEIMKDSHIGTYGVLALLCTGLARWTALAQLFEAGPAAAVAALIVAGVLSRAAMTVPMAALPHARESGLSHHVGRVTRHASGLALALGVAVAILLVGWTAVAPLFWVVLSTLTLGAWARARIGGQTGDILGATQQMAEIAVLVSMAAATGSTG